MENTTIQLILGDCTLEHEQITDGSVDLILTDLPYGTVNGIGDSDLVEHGMKGKVTWDSIVPTEKIMQISNRILRKNGKMILFAQQPFTTELIRNQIPNLPFCYSMIWEKDHFANGLIAKKSPVNYYEDILIFSKIHDLELLHPLRPYFKLVLNFIGLNKKTIIDKIGQCADHVFRTDSTQYSLCTEKTYNKLIDVFCINKMPGFKNFSELETINSTFNSTFNLWEGNKYKSNILKYKKDYDGYHPTQKPVLLLEDLIKTFSDNNDLVVDLTMGSGSTGVACANTGRRFVGIEQDENYFKIAEHRIASVYHSTSYF